MKVAGRGTDDVHCPSLLENGLDEIVAALQQPVRIANQQLNFKRHALAHSRRRSIRWTASLFRGLSS